MASDMTEHLVNVDTCTVVQVSEAALPFVKEVLSDVYLYTGGLIVLATACYVVARVFLHDEGTD
jgi:hypothetical protein